MELEYGSGNLRGYRAEEGFFNDIGFVFSANHYQYFLCQHDGFDAHGVCLFGHVIVGSEETLVCFDGGFCKVNAVCFQFEAV